MRKDMSLLLSSFRKAVTGCSLAFVFSLPCLADSSFGPNGGEYAIVGSMPTDQVRPDLALGQGGGYLVWEDTITDGEGLGVSARRLGPGLAGTLSAFRVNETAVGDQERPQVALLKDGGAVFVWQGGKIGFQHIYARFLSADGTWLTGDILVSDFNASFQTFPAVATLANGNVVVVWSSYNQRAPNSLQDVYGRVLSPSGAKVGSEFPVNLATKANQRNPVVAALPEHGFIVAWVSEMQRTETLDNPDPNWMFPPGAAPSVDIYSRKFTDAGSASGGESLVNTTTEACANPTLAVGQDGYLVAWSEMDGQNRTNNWDIVARKFTFSGAAGAVVRLNSYTRTAQFAPQATPAGSGYLVVWNSLLQDGSREGVFGLFLPPDGSVPGPEFMINTTRVSQQLHPVAAADQDGQVLVVWTSFIGGTSSFDLFAQRYVDSGTPLLAMEAPFVHVPFEVVNGSYQPQIRVSWPEQSGLAIDRYEIYVDGSATPAATPTGNTWLMTSANGLKANTTVSVQLAYVTADGRRSPLSAAATAKTWSGYNWGGVPFEWMTEKYGNDLSTWPAASFELAVEGPTVLHTFLSGGDPRDASTWLKTKLVPTQQGLFLTWNPRPGLVYQVQSSSDLLNWQNLGGQRMATSSQDSLFVGHGKGGYYRIVLQR